MLIYDVTDKKSFEELPTWLSEAKQHGVISSNSTLVVIGNKIDEYPRVVTEQQVSYDMLPLQRNDFIITICFNVIYLLNCNRVRFSQQKITHHTSKRAPKAVLALMMSSTS